MSCKRCGGSGRIPLLGPNTTSCPDCQDSTNVSLQATIYKWQFYPASNDDYGTIDFYRPVYYTVEKGDVLTLQCDRNRVILERADVMRPNQTIELDRLPRNDIESLKQKHVSVLNQDDDWDRLAP